VAEAHNNLAVLFEAAGRLEEAIRHYCAALALRPDHSAVADNLTRLLHELRRRDETPGIAAPPACDPVSAEASGHRGAAP
jgi:Flp pilus assembly protein TadD